MKRLSAILLLSCCLTPVLPALGEAAGEQEAATGKPKDLTSELDQFVREAISEGLLTPTGEAEVSEVPAEEPSGLPSAGADVRPTQAAPYAVEVDCQSENPLGFSDFRDFDRYQQINTYQQKVSAAHGSDTETMLELGQAYLALGLYSEAEMALKSVPGAQALAFRKVAMLMDGRRAPDVDYFRRLAACQEDAGVWLGVALLADDRDEGVQAFNENLNGFRKLPFRLRADIAALVVPQLDKRSERVLPVKLIADFDEAQIADTPQLGFVKAIVDLGRNNPEAEKTVRSFLSEPQFQEDALAALMRHGKPLSGVHEEILLGELMRKFGQTGDDHAFAASLQYALQELGSSSNYGPILELADMPALQNEHAQNEIRRELEAALSRDLASDNRLRNLAAINALVSDHAILTNSTGRETFYKSGAGLAVRFGFASIAQELMERVEADEGLVAELAALDFQRQDYGAVASWARAFPGNEAVSLLAARWAIRKGDVSALRAYEAGLGKDPETVLALIEQDAAAGHWIVSEKYYRAALGLSDRAQKARAERVIAMREAASDIAAGPRKMAMAGVPGILKRPEPAQQVTGGVN